MAKFYPELASIQNQKVKPEPGETHLLNFLDSTLDENYEVFFNPFLNGDRPDVIIVRRNAGLLIVEVKDWEFRHYRVDEKRRWRLRRNDSFPKSPLDQVFKYKENMFNLHIEHMLEKKIKNSKLWNVASCAVYFHNENSASIDDFLVRPFSDDKKYLNFIKYNVTLLGRDSLSSHRFGELLKLKRLDGSIPSLFDDEIYTSLLKYFIPPKHTLDQGKEIKYRAQQKRIIQSDVKQQLVKGVVGSGKTTVLAGRAVECLKSTNDKVLILCYNITLKNYIHDKISDIRADFDWANFYITNFHYFLTAELNNYGIAIVVPEGFDDYSDAQKSEYFERKYYSNELIFEEIKDKIVKYKTVLIDEVQDYKIEWLNIVKKYFLDENGTYVLFGDEKQNIYDNEMDVVDNDIKVNIAKNVVSKMTETIRLPPSITQAATKFQNGFLASKYNTDVEFIPNTEIDYGEVTYTFIPYSDNKQSILDYILANIGKSQHPNDICVLGITISLLRELDCLFRLCTNQKTKAMFETHEVWIKLFFDTFFRDDFLQEALQLIGNSEIKKEDDKKIAIASLCTIRDFIDKYKVENLNIKYELSLKNKRIDKDEFEKWYYNKRLGVLKNEATKSHAFNERVKLVRDNKKFHFWVNGGLTIFSTIHSFKGYESEVVFLIVERKYASGDFSYSFDELIYAGLTRAKSKLHFVNYGNTDFDEKIKRILL